MCCVHMHISDISYMHTGLPVLVTFLALLTKYLTRSSLGFTLARSSRVSCTMAVGVGGGWSHGSHTQEADRAQHWRSAFFLPDHSMELATLREDLPSSLNLSGHT